jgi:formylglycine-generating enzyme required for sulfatase activity
MLLPLLALATIAAEPPAGTQIVHPGDGAVMVYVPSGPFTMGIDKADGDAIARLLGFQDAAGIWALEAYPRHTVDLPGFFIDQCEVTVARWKQYVQATGTVLKSKETSRHFDDPAAQQLPAAEILWEDAKKYAVWAGKALPSEAQWEKAARGTDGRLFPWGNDPPTPERGHFGGNGKRPHLYVSVGGFPKGASPCGALDMLGNQYEWTSERKVLYPGHPLDPADLQTEKLKAYCDSSNVALRGGSWYHGSISFYAAKRFGLLPDETFYHIGFRTVWVPPPGYFDSQDFEKARMNSR